MNEPKKVDLVLTMSDVLRNANRHPATPAVNVNNNTNTTDEIWCFSVECIAAACFLVLYIMAICICLAGICIRQRRVAEYRYYTVQPQQHCTQEVPANVNVCTCTCAAAAAVDATDHIIKHAVTFV